MLRCGLGKHQSINVTRPLYKHTAFTFQSAILNYKRVCVLEPNNFEHYSRLAFIYFFQGQCLFDQKLYPEALESFSRAAEMRPEVIGYHTRRYFETMPSCSLHVYIFK